MLSESSMEAMHTPPEEVESGYAMGWRESQFNGTRALHHDGMLMNFSADAWLLPDLETGVVILINQTGLFHSMMAYPELSQGILNLLMKEPATTGMSLSMIYSIVAVVILVSVGFAIRWWLVKFPRWKLNVPGKARGHLIIDILKEIIWPIVLYFGIPYIFLLQSEKRLSWERGFGLAPDLYALLIFAILNGIAKGLAKAWMIYKSSRTVHKIGRAHV